MLPLTHDPWPFDWTMVRFFGSGPLSARLPLLVWLVPSLLGLSFLLFSSWSTMRIEDASDALIEAQGEKFRLALRQYVGEPDRPPGDDRLKPFLNEQAAAGLRFVAIQGPQRFFSAGTPVGPTQPSADEVGVRHLGEVARVVLRPGSGGPAFIVFEFVPESVRGLKRNARWGLFAGVFVGLVGVILGRWCARLLQERDILQERTAQQRRLMILGEMSAVMAHELRTPVTGLKGHAQLLLEDLVDGSEAHQRGQRVVRSIGQLETCIADLLAFATSGRLRRELVDPGLLAQEALDGMPGSPRIELSLAEAPSRWSLDPERFRRVLSNLFRNAIEANPEGASDVRVAMRVRAGRLEVEVRDFGEGVAVDKEKEIFVPFFSEKASGAGLGLAVVRQLVEAHGGTVSVQNHVDGGAVFSVSIPQNSEVEV
jgi:signal transduction histidine kinase